MTLKSVRMKKMACSCEHKGRPSGLGSGAYSQSVTGSTYAWNASSQKRSRSVTVNAETEASRKLTHTIPNERRINVSARRSHPCHS